MTDRQAKVSSLAILRMETNRSRIADRRIRRMMRGLLLDGDVLYTVIHSPKPLHHA